MTKTRTALILGATGGIGGAMARRLLAGGWMVRAMHRQPEAQKGGTGIEWVRGDAMVAADVMAAAAGMDWIIHAVNPPGYRHWDRLVLPMLDNSIAAARHHGARLLLPGNLYVFGPDAFPEPGEDAPQNPQTAKGRIRVEMEARLRRAAQTGVPALVVRAGDFFGPEAGNNWFSQAMVKPGRQPRAITYPGRPGIGHQWAYLPDVAETMVQLMEKADTLPDFAAFNMEGHWDGDGKRMVEAIRRALGRPDLPVRAMPWRMMRLLAPFVPLFRELLEMRYLWRQPVRMRNARLCALLGAEPHTDWDIAVADSVRGLSLPDQPPGGRHLLSGGGNSSGAVVGPGRSTST